MTKSHSDLIVDRSVRNQCAVCGFMERGFAYSEPKPGSRDRVRLWACSREHQALLKGLINMTFDDLNRNEQEALWAGGQCAGQYLEEIEIFDLSDLTSEQYATFILKVLEGFRVSLEANCVRDERPEEATAE